MAPRDPFKNGSRSLPDDSSVRTRRGAFAMPRSGIKRSTRAETSWMRRYFVGLIDIVPQRMLQSCTDGSSEQPSALHEQAQALIARESRNLGSCAKRTVKIYPGIPRNTPEYPGFQEHKPPGRSGTPSRSNLNSKPPGGVAESGTERWKTHEQVKKPTEMPLPPRSMKSRKTCFLC